MKWIGLLFLILLLTGCSTGKAVAGDTFIADSGDINLYFCPQQQCEEHLLQFLDSAQESIHCAFYDIGLPSVQKKIVEKEAKIEVEIVTDSDYIKKFNHPFVKKDSYGLMHNKFCIIDGQKVSTGSMNPTENDAHKNNNNLLLINSPVIAQSYEDEFQELWAGVFKKGEKIKNPKVNLSGIPVQTYFCPEDHCEEQVRAELKKAQKSIFFMIFSFTDQGIGNDLLIKNLDNLELRGVMETTQISEFSQFQRLKQNGIPVRKDGNSHNLHHKVFIIDGKTVITGSFNPSANGDKHNDENVFIIENEEIATRFKEEFEKVYAEGTD